MSLCLYLWIEMCSDCVLSISKAKGDRRRISGLVRAQQSQYRENKDQCSYSMTMLTWLIKYNLKMCKEL